MLAPELHPQNLLSIEMVAQLAGLTPESLMEYVRRQACPLPTVRQNRTPLWSEPIINTWLVNRRRRGQSAVVLANPRHPVRLDRVTGRTGIQVGKVVGSPWSLVVTTDTTEPIMVDLSHTPLLAEWIESPFRLDPGRSRTRVFRQCDDGSELEVPCVSEVIADWVTRYGAGDEPELVP